MNSSVLDSHKLYYEDVAPRKLNTRKTGGKDRNIMANKPEVKTENSNRKKYAKSRGEHVKDVMIAVLIAGVIAFIGGMHFANAQHAQMESAVKAAQTASVAPAKK